MSYPWLACFLLLIRSDLAAVGEQLAVLWNTSTHTISITKVTINYHIISGPANRIKKWGGQRFSTSQRRLQGRCWRGNFRLFGFSRAQENAFPGAFVRFAMVYLMGTNCLWSKRWNGASCNTLSKAENPFCQRIFFVQQKWGSHGLRPFQLCGPWINMTGLWLWNNIIQSFRVIWPVPDMFLMRWNCYLEIPPFLCSRFSLNIKNYLGKDLWTTLGNLLSRLQVVWWYHNTKPVRPVKRRSAFLRSLQHRFDLVHS